MCAAAACRWSVLGEKSLSARFKLLGRATDPRPWAKYRPKGRGELARATELLSHGLTRGLVTERHRVMPLANRPVSVPLSRGRARISVVATEPAEGWLLGGHWLRPLTEVVQRCAPWLSDASLSRAASFSGIRARSQGGQVAVLAPFHWPHVCPPAPVRTGHILASAEPSADDRRTRRAELFWRRAHPGTNAPIASIPPVGPGTSPLLPEPQTTPH